MTSTDIWPVIRAERESLARDLAELTAEQWATMSLSSDWTVEQTLAHLTAVANIRMGRWIASVVSAKGDFDLHNERRMHDELGRTPEETLARYRASVPKRTRILGPKAGAIGEIVIHAEDIRRPLGLAAHTSPEIAAGLMQWFAANEFAVISKSRVQDLTLVATDAPVRVGAGPVVSGPALSLLMVTCGRAAHLDDLDGPGLDILVPRCTPEWKS